MIPGTEPEVDMGGFHFEVDANLEQSRIEANKIWLEYGIGVMDLEKFESDGQGDDV